MPTYGFGAGVVWATPLTDNTGAAVANPTPVIFGTLQEVTVDISGDVKELYGQNQFAEAVARGKAKISSKAKNGRFNGLLLNTVFFGGTVNSGLVANYYDTTGITVATTVTIVPPLSGTYAKDLGVRNSIGNPITRVASAPATGQYAVNEVTGVYTFNASDVGQTVFISYGYTATSTVAKNSTIMNLQMGAAPTFRVDLSLGFNGNNNSLTLYSNVATKLSIATKLDDFAIPEFDFSAQADSTGRVLKWGTPE